MKAAQIEKKDSLKIIETEIPVPKENELLIEVFASGICGTDLHIFKGDYKGTYPIVPGHELSGIVRKAGKKIRTIKVGDRVALEPNISCGVCYNCLNNRQHFCENIEAIGVTLPGGMAQFVCAPEQAVFPIVDLSFEEAAFMEPLSCVLHGVEQVNPHLADTVLLIGAGPIGLLLLQSFLVKGCSSIHIVDRDEERLKIAKEMGASYVSQDLSSLEKESYHIVCDATGVTSLMEATLNYVRPAGRILWFAVPHVDAKVSISPFEMFAKEISIFSTYTSCRNSWQALSLLQSGRIRVKELISHRLSLEDFERGLKILETHSEPAMKIMILPKK
ncbi:L-threonine 3-dehydrogenase [Oceanispirochaeta crateris]|uniref:L-threonine 3-dehydrogenase n=1 Tax=Oceanispirochaeta crateris TaxID=2518645 RepID=A0A5C1QKP7_9SPIO|nr:zinc-dependent alcohol dehydrogenase family protein [Oceanispirochaeta crateris]QEN08047.1 L-threonine 3-dehydrogenase [Oceanispirochaeta crateris]